MSPQCVPLPINPEKTCGQWNGPYDLNISCTDGGGFIEGGAAFEVDLITVVATDGTAGDSVFVSRTLQAVVTTGTSLP